MHIESVDEVLTTTRAVRRRLDLTRPVERDVILDCVRLAMQALTASTDQNCARYVAISKPLWSRADGYHRLAEQSDGSTLLTFHETYHAFNSVARALFERRVHTKIIADNLATYAHALGFAGTTRRLS